MWVRVPPQALVNNGVARHTQKSPLISMIILINGTMNAGKTTVAKILATKIPRVAHVEKLRQFIEWMPIEESIPLNIQNIISLAQNFAQEGLNVIISYPVSNQNYARISSALKPFGPIHAFTLNPKIEIATSNRGTRELKSWEVDQIKKSYMEGLNKPEYGTIIDNSEQTPEQTAKIILSAIQA
jgi:hypothetical protein